MDALDNLNKLLSGGMLSKPNAERVTRIFRDAARLVYERQKRLHKAQLKMRDISSALILADFIHSDAFRFEVRGELAKNLGECSEADAINYYEKQVMGVVTDKFGRQIHIDEEGMRSLYKDRESNKHVVTSENYETVRGKRLPWIRHTLQNSHTVCISDERRPDGTLFRRSYLYFAIVSIPVKDQLKVSYYVVVVKEEKSGSLAMVTACGMYEWNKMLNVLEPTKPYN